MNIYASVSILLCVLFQPGSLAASDLQDSRVEEIAKVISVKPLSFAPPIQDRDMWGKLAQKPYVQRALKEAQSFKQSKLPQIDKDLYLDFSRTGNQHIRTIL